MSKETGASSEGQIADDEKAGFECHPACRTTKMLALEPIILASFRKIELALCGFLFGSEAIVFMFLFLLTDKTDSRGRAKRGRRVPSSPLQWAEGATSAGRHFAKRSQFSMPQAAGN